MVLAVLVIRYLAHHSKASEFLIELVSQSSGVSNLLHHSKWKGTLFLRDKCSDEESQV
jgi:hypothetical protein